jgi:hypothetical protein
VLQYEAGHHARAAAQGDQRQQALVPVRLAGHLGCRALTYQPPLGQDERPVERGIRPVPCRDEDQLGHRHRAADQPLRQPHPTARNVFDRAYTATYGPAREIIAEIYDEVADGTELRSVILAERRLGDRPMSEIGGSPMWKAGDEVHAGRGRRDLRVDPFTAGVFVGTMTAQIDEFAERGHPWSEIVNESVIEAVDSLLPYMHARNVAHMADNCSRTARLGARRWGPRFQSAYEQIAYPAAEHPANEALLTAFDTHPVHEALAAAAKLRPSVDISVGQCCGRKGLPVASR